MPLAQTLSSFRTNVAQCDSLIASAHKQDQNGAFIFSQLDREQITVAAFLNAFIAWEAFLEASLADFMTGEPTGNGTQPVKYVSPPTITAALALIVGVMKYFDYANHEFVKKIAKVYFRDGYPYDQPLSGIVLDLADLKAMRNASAHLSTTTKTALESLALRIFGQPQPGISVYRLLTTVDPRSAAGDTVYAVYRDKLLVTAGLIAQG